MSTMTDIRADVDEYLGAVRAHLDDLPPDERDELLEDLESHLLEVAAESDEPLATRLGPPDEYAADLRASAGLPPSGTTRRSTLHLDRAERTWRRVVDHPNARRVREFLPELRPGWWVLRGLLAVWVLSMITNDVDAGDIPFPPLFGSRFVGFLAMVAAVPLSVRLGRRQAGNRRLTRGVHFGEALLLLLTLPLLASLNDRQVIWNRYDTTSGFEQYGGVLLTSDGRPITNLYATDADGNPIEEFRLYDEEGKPVSNLADTEDYSTPEGTLRSQPPIDDDGRPVPNGFPRDAWLERWDGSTAPVVPPALNSTATTSPPGGPSATTYPPLSTDATTTLAPATTAAPETTTPETTVAPTTSTIVAPG